jgi:hypothetical protein
MSTPRRHHFIPVSYLAGFTSSGKREDSLWVHDTVERKRWRSRPQSVGFGKDFYRISLEGKDDFELERNLALAEGEVVPALYRVLRNERLLAEDLERLLFLFALQAVRGTGIRDIFQHAAREYAMKGIHVLASDRQAYQNMLRLMADAGHDNSDIPPFEILSGAIEHGEINFTFNQTEILKESFNQLQFFYHLLAERKWSLSKPAPGAGHFVTSENPLTVAAQLWPTSAVAVQLVLPPGEYIIPLSHSLVLVGRRENAVVLPELDRESVAVVNAHAIAGSRFIFSPFPEFEFVGKDAAIMHSDAILI